MIDRAQRDAEMSKEEAEKLVQISMSNFNRTSRNETAEDVRVRCLYDCDCTVVGGTDPVPPFGTAAGVVGFGVGDMTS